jgi:hypothetical protein
MSPRQTAYVPRDFTLPVGRPSDNLTSALRHLLISGSDARLHVDDRQFNIYGCQPYPRPDALAFSSSTASSISAAAYAAAEQAFAALCEAGAVSNFEHAFGTLCAQIRSDIAATLNIDNAAVVLSPSGTDSAMQALVLSHLTGAAAVTSIVAGVDETGSGVGHSAAGRHFNERASAGTAVTKGGRLAGFENADTIAIAAQDANGARTVAAIDADVQDAVAKTVAAGRRAVLYAMDHSKIGARYPSAACIDSLLAQHGDAVQVVIDACQARLSRRRLQSLLDRDFMVLITGSKFFTGPPLSGALLVPERLCAMAAADRVPAGLGDYSSAYDWPQQLTALAAQLPFRANIGQALRWTAALAEMRGYFAVPDLIRRIIIAEFGDNVARALRSHAPDLRLLPEPQWLAADEWDDEFGVRTIFPFIMRRAGKPLSMAEARLVHRALNEDVSDLMPGQHCALAARLCHVGQPVEIANGEGGTTGALRISADARLVSDAWAGGGMAAAMERLRLRCRQVGLVLDKTRLLVSELDRLKLRLTAR